VNEGDTEAGQTRADRRSGARRRLRPGSVLALLLALALPAQGLLPHFHRPGASPHGGDAPCSVRPALDHASAPCGVALAAPPELQAGRHSERSCAVCQAIAHGAGAPPPDRLRVAAPSGSRLGAIQPPAPGRAARAARHAPRSPPLHA
jgi:hypothetical protein